MRSLKGAGSRSRSTRGALRTQGRRPAHPEHQRLAGSAAPGGATACIEKPLIVMPHVAGRLGGGGKVGGGQGGVAWRVDGGLIAG